MGKGSVFFEIDALPVSVNKAVRHSRKGSYKSQEFKDWVELVFLTQKEQTILNSEWYGVEVLLYFPLYYKNGNIRRKDADDMLKYAIDTTLLRLIDEDGDNIDDSRIIEGHFEKFDNENESCAITFYCVP